jgi:hypothetical protein
MTEPSAATLSSRRVLRLFVLAAAGAQLLADNQISLAPAFPGLASEREPGPEDFDRIEGEFGLEAALKVGGLPEAVLLAREQEIADRIALAP